MKLQQSDFLKDLQLNNHSPSVSKVRHVTLLLNCKKTKELPDDMFKYLFCDGEFWKEASGVRIDEKEWTERESSLSENLGKLEAGKSKGITQKNSY